MRSPARILASLAAAYLAAVILLTLVNWLFPQRGGWLALSQIFAPYLSAPVLLVAPLLVIRGGWRLRGLALIGIALVIVRFGPALTPCARVVEADQPAIKVATWNLLADNRDLAAITDWIRAVPADLVALQELSREHAAAIGQDAGIAARFPHRILKPHGGFSGLGLLSRYPIEERGDVVLPRAFSARISLPDGVAVEVLNSHPPTARTNLNGLVNPFDPFDPAPRDAVLGRLRARVDHLLVAGEPFVMLGDFNVTEREPAHRELTRGLSDAHAAAGAGFGHTWRHQAVKWLRFGLLRIDYVFAGPHFVPLLAEVDCTPRGSDHCPVRAVLGMR